MTTGSFRLSAFKCWRRRFPFVVRNLFSFKKLRYWGCWLLLRCGPIIILFQLVDSVSRFLSEKLQNNKIQLRKSFFFSTRSFVHRGPLFCSFGNLWEVLRTFIFYLWWTYHFCRRDQRRIGSLGTRQTAPVCHLSIRCACGLPFEKVCPKLQR